MMRKSQIADYMTCMHAVHACRDDADARSARCTFCILHSAQARFFDFIQILMRKAKWSWRGGLSAVLFVCCPD